MSGGLSLLPFDSKACITENFTLIFIFSLYVDDFAVLTNQHLSQPWDDDSNYG